VNSRITSFLSPNNIYELYFWNMCNTTTKIARTPLWGWTAPLDVKFMFAVLLRTLFDFRSARIVFEIRLQECCVNFWRVHPLEGKFMLVAPRMM